MRTAAAPANSAPAHAVFGVLSLLIVAGAGVLSVSEGDYFRRYFGDLNPVAVVVSACFAGWGALCLLAKGGWFEIHSMDEGGRGIAVAAALATLIAIPVIGVDIAVGYPRDINVPAPPALLFYPVVAFVVEVVFHLLPLTVLLVGLRHVLCRRRPNRLIWLCLGATALLEPVLQMWFALDGRETSGLAVYTGVHVALINIVQLMLFRRFGFTAMYGFRFVYYGVWHIVWGTARLHLLF